MSQRCRQKLAMDAEKLDAACELWAMYNDFLAYDFRFLSVAEYLI